MLETSADRIRGEHTGRIHFHKPRTQLTCYIASSLATRSLIPAQLRMPMAVDFRNDMNTASEKRDSPTN
eukprot:6423737-Amphidinium_carterae.1